jgi:signal transduction histidine kinase
MKTRITTILASLLVASLFFSLFTGCRASTTTTLTTSLTDASRYSLEQRNDDVAATAVHVAALGLGQALKGLTVESERVKLVQNFIDPIRFFNDQSGYFYVYYDNCTNLAHAVDKTLPGKDLTNYTDSKGLLVIQELSKKAQAGGGIVTFWWPHPQTKEEQRKIGYVEPIPGTDYFIGTGYYPTTQ